MTVLGDVVDYLIGCSALFLSYAFSVMAIHCFSDERLPVTRKKHIIAGAVIAICQLLLLLDLFPFRISVNGSTFVTTELVLAGLCLQRGIGIGANFRRVLLFFFSQLMLTLSSVIIIVMLVYGFSGKGMIGDEGDNVSRLASTVADLMMLLILLLAYIYIYRAVYAKGLAMSPRNTDVVLMGIYCIYVLIMAIVFAIMDEEDVQLVAEFGFLRAIFTLVTAGVTLAMPYFIVRNRLSAYYKDLSDHQQSFLDAELAASRQYREAQEETRAFRHDVQNELAVISALMKEKHYDQAEAYLNDMLTEVRALSPKVITGDDMLDTLISSKLGKLTENSVVLSIDGVLEGGLNWKPMDKCRVFANALDNAFEACMKLPPDVRQIALTMQKTRHQRFITISNPCCENVDCTALLSGQRVTSKEDKQLHGYGIQSIRSTVEKYGGLFNLSCEDNRFVMEIILMDAIN